MRLDIGTINKDREKEPECSHTLVATDPERGLVRFTCSSQPSTAITASVRGPIKAPTRASGLRCPMCRRVNPLGSGRA